MLNTKAYLFLQIIYLNILQTDCTECYNCNGAIDVVCNITVVCPDDKICYKKTFNEDGHERNVQGCEDKQLCLAGKADGPGLVGRDIHLFSRRSGNTTCHECCTGDLCNQNLCTYSPNSSDCSDDPTLDCARLSTLLDLCDDVEHAIKTCPKFCNLCPIDGRWSDWSDWSSCNVTCDRGIQTRTRQCDSPAPLNGGHPCNGDDTEIMACDNNPCPVPGGWSVWSEWGTCSATCDVGIQRRDRHCSNPYPDKYGDHCFGDARDDRICMSSPCANGGWSSWDSWGSCSVTCGGGLKKRQRACTNPAPSSFGQQCAGTDMDTDRCNEFACRGKDVNFFVRNGILSSSNGTVIFPGVYHNTGSGYNTSTGEFTAPVSGMYTFTTQLCNDARTDFVISKIFGYIAYSFLWPSDDIDCSSATGTTHLDKGDIVIVYSYQEVPYHAANTFSGHLVHSYE